MPEPLTISFTGFQLFSIIGSFSVAMLAQMLYLKQQPEYNRWPMKMTIAFSVCFSMIVWALGTILG